MSEINFKATTVFNAIYRALNEKEYNKHKYKLIVEEGGSRSSKTWSNFQVLYLYLFSNPASSVTVLRDTQKSCRDIVEKDWKNWINDPMVRKKEYEDGKITVEQYDEYLRKENLKQYLIENKTNHTWTFKHNGNVIWFTGLDDENLAMGMTQSICWINEPYDFSQDVYKQLAMRSKVIIFDWNPKQNHWVEIEKAKDTTFTHYSTFKDNPFILPETKQQILSYQPLKMCEAVNSGLISISKAHVYDCELNELNIPEKQLKELKRCQNNEKFQSVSEYDWMVYGLGLKSEKPNKIYNGWKPITLEKYESLKKFYTPYYGLDFGFSNPSACVEVLYDGDDNFYVKEILYKPIRLMGGSIGEELLAKGVPIGNVTYMFCDSSDKEAGSDINQINDLRAYYNINAVPVKKPGYKERFDFITKMKIHYVSSSENLIREYDNYEFKVINGQMLEEPIKKDDHCFVGDTMITTINGDIKIKDIKVGDMVLTRNGYKKVLLKHNNGVKKVSEYSMLLNTNFVSLCCTDDHLICTSKEWKQFTKLSKGDKLFLPKFLAVKNTDYIKEKGILVKVIKGFIEKFGNIIKGIYQTVMTYITLMVIHLTIKLKTLIWSKGDYTLDFQVKKDLSITLNLQKNFREKVQKHQKAGILRMKALNFIEKLLSYLMQKEFQRRDNARFAEKVMKQKQSDLQNIAIQTATLNQFDFVRNYEDNVYDLTVEDEHEYFANGILVSNCMNAMEYCLWMLKNMYNINF